MPEKASESEVELEPTGHIDLRSMEDAEGEGEEEEPKTKDVEVAVEDSHVEDSQVQDVD